MFDTNVLLVWLLLSSIWLWYFTYWKKAWSFMSILSGSVLMIFPYFVTNMYYLVWIWLLCVVLPFIIKV